MNPNTSVRWGDCEMVYSSRTRQMQKEMFGSIWEHVNRFPSALECNIWYDHTSKELFSGGQQIATPHAGKHHSFISQRSNFFRLDFSGPPNLVNMGSAYRSLADAFKHIQQRAFSPELYAGITPKLQGLIGQQDSVFIVGGGPSTLNVDFEKYSEIPKWTMNNYFKNEKIKNLDNIQLVSFLDDINLDDEDLWRSVKKNDSIVMQEISDPNYGNTRSNKIISKAGKENASYFCTRYRSRLGIGPRLLILATQLGIKNIYFSGFDGYDISSEKTHAFEENKSVPSWLKLLGPKIQKQQFVIFWDYVVNELKRSKEFKIHDLSKGCNTVQYKFIQDILL